GPGSRRRKAGRWATCWLSHETYRKAPLLRPAPGSKLTKSQSIRITEDRESPALSWPKQSRMRAKKGPIELRQVRGRSTRKHTICLGIWASFQKSFALNWTPATQNDVPWVCAPPKSLDRGGGS